MNKAIISTLLVAALMPATGMAAENVPYSSDLGSNYSICSDWQNLKGGGANYWTYDRDSSFATPGTMGGMMHTWEPSESADAMLVSPAITLTEGSTYTVSVWIKTSGNAASETEKFKVMMGTASDLASMKSSTVLIQEDAYQNNSDFEKFAKTFTADATGDFYFGIYCCSDYFQGNLCATGFSIVEGEGGDVPEQPEVVKDVPFTADFKSAAGFKEWSSLAGPAAEVTEGWSLNSYMGFAEFDRSNGVKEDNYFISPALNLDAAGDYVINMEYTAYGSFDLVLGTDNAAPESFDQVLLSVDNVEVFNEPAEVSFSITTPGKYYIAMHVRADVGSYMGYRLHSFKIKNNLPVPALVTDLKAEADVNDGLTVELSWTNPSLTNLRTELDNITKVDIVCNGEILKTLTDNLTPGAQANFTDNVETAGVYSYSVVVYGDNGTFDGEPAVVSAGFVGHPTASFPYEININSADESELVKFTAEDANNDGLGWELRTEYYTTAFYSSNDGDETVSADNYLASPYIHLEKGYYLFTSSMSSKNNNFEVGYATDRHHIADTFVKLGELNDQQEYGYNDMSVVLPIDVEGDYCLVWRHTGMSTSYAYPNVSLGSVKLEAQALLPAVATDVVAVPAADFELKVELTWTNPSLDNANRELESITKAEVLRDGNVIATITTDLTPGRESSYTDETLTESGEHTYSVVVYNDNGSSQAEAPQVTVFVGRGKEVPYEADFAEWTIVNLGAYHEWAVDTDGSIYFERGYFDDSDYNDGIYSPYIYLKEGKRYIVSFDTFGKSGEQGGDFTLQAGLSRDEVGDICEFSKSGTSTEHKEVKILPKSVQTLEDSEDIVVPAGNVVLGFHVAHNADVHIRNFKVELDETYMGVEGVEAAGTTVVCRNGVVEFGSPVSAVAVADLAGRVVFTTNSVVTSVDLSHLAQSVLIVKAVAADGTVINAKVQR